MTYTALARVPACERMLFVLDCGKENAQGPASPTRAWPRDNDACYVLRTTFK